MTAEPMLCSSAAIEIDILTGGESLAEIGDFADRVRYVARWEHSAPWHFINISDDEDLFDLVHPAEGDVLWAIDEYSERLADSTLSRAERATALRFLVHFIVDVHQPLHVGRAEDRGGNRIDIRYGNTTVNLHRFWDTDAVQLAGVSDRQYADSIASAALEFSSLDAGTTPVMWARESQLLRSQVYAFDRQDPELSQDYLARAERLARERLIFAAARLANTLNELLCVRAGA